MHAYSHTNTCIQRKKGIQADAEEEGSGEEEKEQGDDKGAGAVGVTKTHPPRDMPPSSSEEEEDSDDDDLDSQVSPHKPNHMAVHVRSVHLQTFVHLQFQQDKQKGVEGLIEVENPNRIATKSRKARDIDVNAKVELTRREK